MGNVALWQTVQYYEDGCVHNSRSREVIIRSRDKSDGMEGINMITMRNSKVKKEPDTEKPRLMKDKAKERHAPLKATMSDDIARKCLALQHILCGAPGDIIDRILKDGQIVKYRKGQIVTKQGDTGEHSYFILKGALDVLVNGRRVAERCAKECVGEMSVLDPTQNRCATLIAAEEVHLLRIKSEIMEQLLNENISIMRQVACELCVRLRERSKYHECPNGTPKIFIGSSSEGLTIATRLSNKITGLNVSLWNKDVFSPSESNIEALVEQAQSCDFAILVLTPDDWVNSRGSRKIAPRDNVIFELGLFMGAIGRSRTYLLTTTNTMKLPSDLDGITRICCKFNKDGKVLIGDAVSVIMNEIAMKGVR